MQIKDNSNKPAAWQKLLAETIDDPVKLLEALDLDPATVNLSSERQFPLRVPMSFVNRMKRGDINDPLLKQVLPLADEQIKHPQFTRDPLQEKTVNPKPGILHKYHGRVLLTLTGACGIHCRYCFRRHFPYSENTLSREVEKSALDYIRNNSSIREVILSGGDPLVVTDNRLSELVCELSNIPHVKTLRVHTRMPVVIPERITDSLIELLTATRLIPVMVLHSNHAQEIDSTVEQSITRLRDAKIHLLNQAVLLKGINDDSETLIQLSERLFECGVTPYYLHLLDKVEGATHFDVTELTARRLQWEMMQKLPGYLVPRVVREIPGFAAKMPVAVDTESVKEYANSES